MFPNLKNKKFTDINTNESFVVIDQFENIAILNNKERVDVKKLLDRNYYDEYIDPKTFFDEKNLQVFTEKIKSISTEVLNNIKDDDGPAVMSYDPEEEKRLLQEKANEMYNRSNPNDAIRSQMEKFKDMMDEDDVIEFKVDQSRIDEEMGIRSSEQIQHPQQTITQPVQEVHTGGWSAPTLQQDPILSMFKNVKKNVDFKMSIDITNKIPRADFIEMMEDSYDISIIDYLAEEFTQNIIKDPSSIKKNIKEEIEKIVYKKKDKVIPHVPPESKQTEIPRSDTSTKRKYTKKEVK